MSRLTGNIFENGQIEASDSSSVMQETTAPQGGSSSIQDLPILSSYEQESIAYWIQALTSILLPPGPVPSSQIYVTTDCHVTGDFVRAVTGPNHDALHLMVYSEVEKGSWQWVQSKCEACEDKVRTVLDEIRCDIPLAIDLAVEMRNGNATSDKDIKISDINADKITDNLRDIKLTDNGYVINVTITADVQAPSSSSPNVEEEVLIGQEDDITVICGDNNTDDDNEVLEG